MQPVPHWSAAVPKVELHCHLDMIVDPAMLLTLEERGVRLPLRAETLAAAYPVRSYESFFGWAEVAEALEGSLDNYEPLLAVHAERLRAQNLIYTEIIIGSSELPRDHGELLDRMQRFRAFVDGLEQGRLQIEFLIAFGRNRPAERLAEVAERLRLLHRAGLAVGIAIAGPEVGYPIAPLRSSLERLHSEGVGIEVHAGEWAGPESVWDALDNGFPDRIGHGLAAFRDPRLVDALLERGIHLEFCPTSNRKTGVLRQVSELPIPQARAAGIGVSINTDDPGAFECSLNSEYALVAETFGLKEWDFHAIAVNALNARFQPDLRYVESIGVTLAS